MRKSTRANRVKMAYEYMKEQRKKDKVEELKSVLVEQIEKGTLLTRMNCIVFCIGYLESAEFDGVPFEILNYINELFYERILPE